MILVCVIDVWLVIDLQSRTKPAYVCEAGEEYRSLLLRLGGIHTLLDYNDSLGNSFNTNAHGKWELKLRSIWWHIDVMKCHIQCFLFNWYTNVYCYA